MVCGTFDFMIDAMVAKEYLKRITATFNDMVLEDDLRVKVATRLLKDRARVWWENLKGRSYTRLTWTNFSGSSMRSTISISTDQKRQEFMKLIQHGKSVTEYETKLKDLANIVPELVDTEEVLCSKFEVGLNLNIRERMAVIRNQSFEKVV